MLFSHRFAEGEFISKKFVYLQLAENDKEFENIQQKTATKNNNTSKSNIIVIIIVLSKMLLLLLRMMRNILIKYVRPILFPFSKKTHISPFRRTLIVRQRASPRDRGSGSSTNPQKQKIMNPLQHLSRVNHEISRGRCLLCFHFFSTSTLGYS